MDANNDDEVRLGLDLGLGLNDYKPKKRDNIPQNNKRVLFLDLSIPLHTSEHHGTSYYSSSSLKIMGKDVIKQGTGKNGFSINGSKEDDDESRFSMDFSCRKKLRLTRDQTTLLEDSFKQQTTLNTIRCLPMVLYVVRYPFFRIERLKHALRNIFFKRVGELNYAQKHALAEKLSLKRRLVEVWFQNRRARTKLKQTEVDCEFLKKNCERLSEENWRLKKELLELRSSLKMEKPPPPPHQHFLHHNPTERAAVGPEKNEKNRGGSEKKEAAMEVVHQP